MSSAPPALAMNPRRAFAHRTAPAPRTQRAFALLLLAGCLGMGIERVSAQMPPPGPRFPGALEFPSGAAWLNVERPLTLRGLRGKVVLLDFWTYGCINCMHIIPDLKRLEKKYERELVVIGVHTAKFPNEDETANLRSAVLRYDIRHPILNDSGRRYWNALGIGVWPTQVLIDPQGQFLGSVAGEGHYDTLDAAISRTIQQAKSAGRLDTRPLNFALERAATKATPLSFPGKVLADVDAAGTGRIYIADTNHHRIVIVNSDGSLEAVAGTGREGRRDGPFHEATFSSPQGLALRKSSDGTATLYVADTNNHLIRSLNLQTGTVSTVAGTGRQASVVRRSPGGAGTRTAIASPWDLLLSGSSLYIAMAGPHQIWVMNLDNSQIRPYAGSGAEARKDGPLLFSAFAQPSGLATDGKRLFVADSESSSIRAVDLPGGSGAVRSLTHGDLFDFGDRDGPGPQAKLQHPLAVAYSGGILYIADSYNDKLKRLDLTSGVVSSMPVTGTAAGQPGGLYEPGGLSLAGARLYVADTNHHRICIVHLTTGRFDVLPIKNLRPPPSDEPRAGEVVKEEDATDLPVALVAPGVTGEVVMEIRLPAGHKLATGTPHRLRVSTEGEGLTLPQPNVPDGTLTSPVRLPFRAGTAGQKGAVRVTATLFYCSDSQKVCKMKTLRLRLPVEVAAGGRDSLALPLAIP